MQNPRDLKLTTCRAILPTHGIQQSKAWDTQTTQGIQSRPTFTSLKCHGHHGKSWEILMRQSRTRIVVRYCNCVLALKSQLFPGAYQNGGPIGNNMWGISAVQFYTLSLLVLFSLSLSSPFVRRHVPVFNMLKVFYPSPVGYVFLFHCQRALFSIGFSMFAIRGPVSWQTASATNVCWLNNARMSAPME